MTFTLRRFGEATLIAALVCGLVICSSPPTARAATTTLPPVQVVYTTQLPPDAKSAESLDRTAELPGLQLTEEELRTLEQRENSADQLEDFEGGMIVTVLLIVLIVVLIVVLLRR